MKGFVVISAIVVSAVAVPHTAAAQIFTCRDAHGTLLLSSDPCDGSARTKATRGLTARLGAPPQLTSRGAAYEPLIQEHSVLHGVRPDLVRAVIQVESAYNPRALSPKGAMGLMQLMPATAAEFGVLNPFDPAENIRGGVGYLKQLLIRYDNDEELALAAYNAGPTAVDRHGSRIPPFKETRDYLRRITAARGTMAGLPDSKIYKSVDVVEDGRVVVRYTNLRPASGAYQEVPR